MRRMTMKIGGAIIAALTMAGVESCTMHGSDNGDLDGYWYMQQIDTIATGSHTDVHERRIFWGCIGSLIQTEKTGGAQYIYRFEHTGAKLRLYDPYQNIQGRDEKITAERLSELRPMGINSLDETFSVEALSGDKMILKGETLRLYFIKY